MSIYDRLILPRLVALAMRHRDLMPHRERVTRAAHGRVLELGIGSGLNLGLYGHGVTSVIGIDPSPELLSLAGKRIRGGPIPVDLLEAVAEQVPVDSGSVDTVVTTWTLCSVADPVLALREARRVLRPGGTLLFVEHGRAPDARVQSWQDRLTPAWKRISGGCHMNRKIDGLVQAAGFRIDALQTGYMRRPKVLTFMYEGRARPL